MTRDEIENLGVSTDVQTACRAFGLSKSAGYTAVKAGAFPCPVIKVGGRYVVPTAGLLAALGLAVAA